ncbi:hypothetical protein MMC21_006015 [Puttea exsequens]|nr:hypothetical protein [Puttea exsequens]
MAPSHCPQKDAPNANWNFCPNSGAAYFFCVLFGLTLIAHIVQAIKYRKGYSWVIAMGALWQTASYAFRIESIKEYTQSAWYTAWFVLILLAPLWTNAYAYMVLGRMVYNFTVSAKILRVKAWRFALIFVLLDIFAFLVQAAGASMASGDNLTKEQIDRGLHIYMGGVGLQQIFIFFFLGLAIQFQKQMRRETPMQDRPKATQLLYTLYGVLTLITIRIIFRLIEYSRGYDSGIPVHEAYQYIFDSTLMLIALVMFNVIHPGRIMPGKESDFPSRKQRKAIGKNNVMGRAGGSLPMHARAADGSNAPSDVQLDQNPTYPKMDSTPSYGIVS